MVNRSHSQRRSRCCVSHRGNCWRRSRWGSTTQISWTSTECSKCVSCLGERECVHVTDLSWAILLPLLMTNGWRFRFFWVRCSGSRYCCLSSSLRIWLGEINMLRSVYFRVPRINWKSRWREARLRSSEDHEAIFLLCSLSCCWSRQNVQLQHGVQWKIWVIKMGTWFS